MPKRGELWTSILRSMSRIPAINEVSFPGDSRLLAQLRKVAYEQQRRARESFLIFEQNPFGPRLRSHKIQKLSARYARTIYAAQIEADLRVVFYIEGDIVVTVDIGSHDLYRG
jgi:mRNA-degrading endonuclease YafQ of YafQ-DinJ toxin-antitoxin module